MINPHTHLAAVYDAAIRYHLELLGYPVLIPGFSDRRHIRVEIRVTDLGKPLVMLSDHWTVTYAYAEDAFEMLRAGHNSPRNDGLPLWRMPLSYNPTEDVVRARWSAPDVTPTIPGPLP